MRDRIPDALPAAPSTDCRRCPPRSTSIMGVFSPVGFLRVVSAEKGRAIGLVVRGVCLISAGIARSAAGVAASFGPSLVSVGTAWSGAVTAWLITGRACSGAANGRLERPAVRVLRLGGLTLVGSRGRLDSWV